MLFHKLSYTPLTSKQIKMWTAQDPVLLKVLDIVLTGANLDSGTDDLKPFLHRREGLSLQDGCLLWGNRVIIPTRARKDILEELHEGHPGVSRMKSIARGIAWWPGIDHEIETHVKACPECQQNQKAPASASLHLWEWPSRPWSRLHIDYAGPFLGNMFLVAVDAHSKWMEIEMVPAATSRQTITKLGAMFATHGLPQLIVSDNGTAFTSQEFRDFLRQNGIRHTTTASYHPASNGLAERCVQTFKRAMKKEVGQDLQYELSKFLFRYRTTPHTTTGIPPAQHLMGRQLLTPLGRLRPNLSARVHTAQTAQKIQHDKSSQAHHFHVQDKVYVRNFRNVPTWLAGVIVATRGPVSYDIELADDRVVRRHMDNIRRRHITTYQGSAELPDELDSPIPMSNLPSLDPPGASPTSSAQPPLRRSQCIRRPPSHYGTR